MTNFNYSCFSLHDKVSVDKLCRFSEISVRDLNDVKLITEYTVLITGKFI